MVVVAESMEVDILALIEKFKIHTNKVAVQTQAT